MQVFLSPQQPIYDLRDSCGRADRRLTWPGCMKSQLSVLTSRFGEISSFPEDFMFQLTKEEAESLRSQFATSKTGRGGRRYLPYAFTEQGVAMLAGVLSSERAIEVNIAIMRAFVKLRQLLASNEELNRKFAAVIRKLATHDKYFMAVFDELKKLNEQPTRTRKQIGFKTAS